MFDVTFRAPHGARVRARLQGQAASLALGIALGIGLAAAPGPAPAATFDLPSLDPLLNYQPRLPLQVLTSDGVEIAQFGTERRQYLPLERMPKLLQSAVLAVEDARFREHSGVDPRGMARAVLAWMTGGTRQGGSTITQQLVRTMLLTQRFSAERKAKEIMLALKVEQVLSKDRILEIYLNEIFLGQRAYGFAAAAQTYFGKPLDQLGIAETAMLAGLPQNPYYANPLANLDRAVRRQRLVLERMHATGVIDAAQLAAARAERLQLRPLNAPPQVAAAHVAEMARQVVVERFGTAAYSRGLKVVTTLRAADQQAAHAALRAGVIDFDRRGAWRGPEAQEALPAGEGAELERAAAEALKDHRDDETLRVAIVLAATPKEVRVQLASGERLSLGGEALRWVQRGLATKAPAELRLQRGAVVRLIATTQGKASTWSFAQWPEAEAALVALDPKNGQVRALVGGFDFSRQPFNHVTQAWRQPGSSLKPLLYSAALEQRIMPATLVDDLPFTDAAGWSPQNSDGQFNGPMTVRDALAASRNLVSVRLAQHVGVPAARDWIGRFGLEPARQPDNLTIALGTGSVTPMQMAQAYAVLANGGWRVEPTLIARITDAAGKLLFEAPQAEAHTEANRALPERNVFITASLLNDVTRSGTAARAQARLRRADLYGKTGTTNDAVDAWFAGYQPGVAAVVWMGYDKPRSLGPRASGGGIALPIWIDYMAAALKGVRVAAPPPPPAGVVRLGDDWLYSEWAEGGWVERLGDESGTVYAGAPTADGMVAPGVLLESGGGPVQIVPAQVVPAQAGAPVVESRP